MPVSEGRFREVLGQLAGGVAVVTSRGPAGDLCGLTATAVCSVSLDPPLVLASIEQATNTHAGIAASGIFALTLLSVDDAALARRFAGESEGKFDEVGVATAATGAPVLEAGMGYCDCRVVRSVPAGDHTLFIGRVEAAEIREEDETRPLVYYDRAYRRLAPGSLGPAEEGP